MEDVTIKKLKKDLKTVCENKLEEISKTKKFISVQELRKYIIIQYNQIISENRNQITDQEYHSYVSFCHEYEDSLCKAYQEYLIEQKIGINGVPDSQNHNNANRIPANKLDEDPIIKNGHTFYAGKKNTPFSAYAGTNSTYSMADMVCTINIDTPYGPISTALGELQTITYSTYQRKSPVRTLGNMNPKTWVFGQRTIAGSLVFAVFNKHWMMNLYDNLKEKAGMKNWHFITDEIPPFDITITFANEYGFDSRMALYGVHIMTEGQTMSTNDIYIENTYEFVATDLELMDSLRAYQEGKSRHNRGEVIASEPSIDKNNETEQGSNNVVIQPIDQEIDSEMQVTPAFEPQTMFLDEKTLDELGEKKANEVIDEEFKKWQNNKIDENVRNQVKIIYEKEKKRIAEYFRQKRVDKK